MVFRKICEIIKIQEVDEELKVKNFILSRLCYLVGQIALCHLNYLDVNVFNELKRWGNISKFCIIEYFTLTSRRTFLREQKKDNELKKKKDLEDKKKKRTSMVRRLTLASVLYLHDSL